MTTTPLVHQTGPKEFMVNGIEYKVRDCSVGLTPQGAMTGVSAAEIAAKRNLEGIRVLDVCCGVGIVGLTMRSVIPDRIREVCFADINVFNLLSLQDTLRHNGMTADSWLSDALQGVPFTEKFDVIVSNPPHYDETPGFKMSHQPDPVGLGTFDPGWEFHRHFYADCHKNLTPGGEVWFLENGRGATEETLLPFIEANPQLEYMGSTPDVRDKVFFWMVTKRRPKIAA